jgi:hypothetical protein
MQILSHRRAAQDQETSQHGYDATPRQYDLLHLGHPPFFTVDLSSHITVGTG